MQILYRARILGLWLGMSASIHDRYRTPLDKLSQALQEFSAIRQRMSLAMRVAIVNQCFLCIPLLLRQPFLHATRYPPIH